jgi:hypothetical protein
VGSGRRFSRFIRSCDNQQVRLLQQLRREWSRGIGIGIGISSGSRSRSRSSRSEESHSKGKENSESESDRQKETTDADDVAATDTVHSLHKQPDTLKTFFKMIGFHGSRNDI